MEIGKWVEGLTGGGLHDGAKALSTLQRVDSEGNWLISEEDGFWYLMVGDQWVVRSRDKAEFDALVIGAAAGVALLRQ